MFPPRKPKKNHEIRKNLKADSPLSLLVYQGNEEIWTTRRKSLEQLEDQLQNQATYDTGPHWWEVSSLTTAPSLLPNKRDCRNEIAVRRGSTR